MMAVNLDDLYELLRSWAVAKQMQPYKELSRQYKERTGDWFEPHGSWDEPLGELNRRLADTLRAPALSALVILNDAKEPGGKFWGSAPNVPPRPKAEIDRLAEWARIVQAVHRYPWPPTLPKARHVDPVGQVRIERVAPVGEPNDAQQRFCVASGAVRLLAPAGCGKTQSLLWRCRHLAERDAAERPRFLVFTFTRAARDELKDRLTSDPAFQSVSAQVTITTLNSWGFRRLKAAKHNLQLKVSKPDRFFTLNNVLQPIWSNHKRLREVLDDSRRKNQATNQVMDLLDLLKSLGFRHDRVKTVQALMEHVSSLEACGMRPHVDGIIQRLVDLEVIRDERDPMTELHRHFVRFWAQATEHLYESAIISLEDQKYWASVDLEQQLLKKTFWTGAARHHHVLVDEFQDINPLDLSLLKAISAINKTDLTIVGDDDQAIYEWRAASPDFILDPDRHIGRVYETVVLGTNYRSPKNIVELSQKLIKNNKRRVDKEVSASSTATATVEVVGVPSLATAIDHVVKVVRGLLEEGACGSVALIGRKRSQIIPYQIVFAGQGIPFYAAEDLQVFLSEAFNHMKEILAVRARADGSWSLYGASPTSDLLMLCDKVRRYPLKRDDRESLRAHLVRQGPKTLRDALEALRTYRGPLKGANHDGNRSAAFCEVVEALLHSKDVAGSIAAISEHFDGLSKDYGKSLDDIFYSDPPFLHLSEYAQRYGEDYVGFITDVERAMATLARIPPEEEGDGEQDWKLPLHLMTALRAKGKEFDAVIILDANDGIWPSRLAETEAQMEQERRTFYVAMTRAKKRLIFLVNDTILHEPTAPSRYLAEMGLSVTRLGG